MIVDHICFAVKDLQAGIEHWKTLFGYVQMTEIVTNTRQKVNVVFLKKSESVMIKLIEPVSGNLAMERFVEKGGGFHHLCFKCDNINEGVADLKKKGMIKLVNPQPGEAFENEHIAFLLTRFGLNVELIDTDKKAKVINP